MRILEQFWMVWADNGSAPTFKHHTASGARAEAERLASMNPGQTFFVLEALSASRRKDVLTVPVGEHSLKDVDDSADIPF